MSYITNSESILSGYKFEKKYTITLQLILRIVCIINKITAKDNKHYNVK